jgi:hypothetical protein
LNQAKVTLPEKTIEETTAQLTKILTTHQELPETWTVVGDFITYRSQMIRGWQEANLPLCDSQFHQAPIVSMEKGSNVIEHGPVDIHDCKMILDSPDATANLSLDLSIGDVIFTHCAIFYNGGPIILTPFKAGDAPAHFVGDAYFKDCLFVVSLPKVPDERGREFARELLASRTGDIKLARPS